MWNLLRIKTLFIRTTQDLPREYQMRNQDQWKEMNMHPFPALKPRRLCHAKLLYFILIRKQALSDPCIWPESQRPYYQKFFHHQGHLRKLSIHPFYSRCVISDKTFDEFYPVGQSWDGSWSEPRTEYHFHENGKPVTEKEVKNHFPNTYCILWYLLIIKANINQPLLSQYI